MWLMLCTRSGKELQESHAGIVYRYIIYIAMEQFMQMVNCSFTRLNVQHLVKFM